MPQTFQVLRCYKCAVFQVHPIKKSNKWICKLCGEKQSLKRFYGIGTGKECRVHVQKLNGIRGDIDNAKCESEESDELNDTDSSDKRKTAHQAIIKNSKWLEYIDTANEDDKLSSTYPYQTDILDKPTKHPRKSVIESNEFSLTYENGECSGSKIFVNDVPNESAASTLKFNEPTICHYNNVPSHTKNVLSDKCVLNESVQNSKWAQYIEDDQNSNVKDPIINTNDSPDALKTFFSLFNDDVNLDAILEL